MTTTTNKPPETTEKPEPMPPFGFVPLPAIPEADGGFAPRIAGNDPDLADLGLLADLAGTWQGPGFNVIWRPFHDDANPSQHHFLELNLTREKIVFEPIKGDIPNRGLLQPDIVMNGLTYLQQIVDTNANNAGLHIEPGIWATVPATTSPLEAATVVRMGSIPHGTTIHAQGSAFVIVEPKIADVSIVPFTIGDPTALQDFDEQHLDRTSAFRSTALTGIDQAHVNNPNLFLQEAIAGQNFLSTTVLAISTGANPVPGGGTANTAFLQGATPPQANADAVTMTAIFWIEKVQPPGGRPAFLQLQYTQTVMLNFGPFSWPHVTVATLRKTAPHERGHFAGSGDGSAG
jgi:hypothetical protein